MLTQQWQTLLAPLKDLAATTGGGCIAASPGPKTHYLLTDAGVIEVDGLDATTFLQGQLTADCAELPLQDSCWAAHCNPQGRVISSFFLHKIDEQRYLLYLPANNIANALTALKKYAVFSKVTVEDASSTFCAIGLKQEKPPVDSAVSIQLNNELSVALVDWSNLDAIDRQLRGLPQNSLGGSSNWNTELIRAGYAMVESASSGEHVAQMLNMDLLDGISFSKGCYTGQEVIARLKYKGEAKRRCYRLRITHDANALEAANMPVKAGQIITLDTAQNNAGDKQRPQAIGEVVSAASDGNTIYALAVLKNKSLESFDTPTTQLSFASADKPEDSKKLSVVIDHSLPPYAIN